MVMDILKYGAGAGAEVEVLEPAELRAQVAERLRAALGCYGGCA